MLNVIHNGRLIEKKAAQISIFSKAAYFDFGVYDSLKIVNGKIFLPEFHIKRFLHSAELIKLEHPYREKELLGLLKRLIETNKLQNSLIRLLMYGSGQKGEEVELFMFPVGLTFYPDKFYREGIKVIFYEGERLLPQVKSMDLLLGFLALREAYSQNALEALLVNQKGEVAEGTRSNLFIVKNKVLITPPAEEVLVGAGRQAVLKIADKLRIKTKEAKIRKQDLLKADEIFVTSVGLNIMPVSQVDNKKFIVGGLTEKLIKEYRQNFHAWQKDKSSVFDGL